MSKWIFLILLVLGCVQREQQEQSIDIQGHRGARGLSPENSIPAFLLAVEMGVNTLEMDLVVSKDSQLVVSHEPYFSPHFCVDSLGNEIPEDRVINLYQLNYADIRKFDCGSKGNPRFPEQEELNVAKPTLEEVIDTVEALVKRTGIKPIRYNIELKTARETDYTFHPTPEAFSDLVYMLISDKEIWDRVNIQSFDFRTLQYFHKQYPEVDLAVLIENHLDWETNIDSLGFTPQIYSPHYLLLSQEKVREIQRAGMMVIPWTVNEVSDINKVIAWKVDGIISDYPDRALKATKKK